MAALATGLVAAVIAVIVTQPHAHSRIAIGVALPDAPESLSDLHAYTRMAGAAPAIVLLFRGFDDKLLYSTEEHNLIKVGSEPMVTWDPSISGQGIPLSEIADGEYDAYIKSQARLARDWRRPMYIRFGHEMNLPTWPWRSGINGNTPAEFIAAWRHVVAIFRRLDATNVRWVWAPNVNCGGRCPFEAYYPGNAWVNEVALDGYNYGTSRDDRWMSFRDVFLASYRRLTALSDRPVMITETGTIGTGAMKAAWIREAFLHAIPQSFPRVDAVIWWDRPDGASDVLLDTSSASIDAWRQMVALGG